jgi:uncharacterized membrane protein YkvA (DUF1232 family)
MRARFHPDQNLWAKIQKSLSKAVNFGRGCFRFNAASCGRRARFSSSSARRARNRRRIAPTRSKMALIIRACYRISPADSNPLYF